MTSVLLLFGQYELQQGKYSQRETKLFYPLNYVLTLNFRPTDQ